MFFFIFVVSNLGGALTPIGDPPLFLGYLRGVPFFWLAERVVMPWLVTLGLVLAAFYVFDLRSFRRMPRRLQAEAAQEPETWRVDGAGNVLLLGVIIGAVFLPDRFFLRELTMLAAAVVFGGSYLLAKMMTDRTNATVVVAQLSFWVTLGLIPMAWSVWETPDLHTITILMVVATLATAGHYTMTLAFSVAPVTVTQPVTFLQLVWAVSLGAFVFGEPIDPWVVVGGLVILGAVSFITWREAVLKRRTITPPANATKV